MQIYLPHRRRHHGASGNGFLTSLVDFWNLDETSGDAISATGGTNLTDSNTVTYSAGGAPDGGNARQFTGASNEKFSASGLLGSGTNITLAIWFKADTISSARFIWGHNAPNGMTTLRNIATTGILYVVFDGSTSRIYNSSIGTGWHSIVVTSTGPAGTDKAYLDGAEFTSSAVNQGWEPGTATYYLGANQIGQNGSTWDGAMASHGIWSKVFDATDVSNWHNGGVNLRYADLTS